MQPDLMALLVCPSCHADLRREAASLQCSACRAVYPVRAGIPILLAPQALHQDHDEIDHHHEQKAGQAAWFDRHTAEEFEIERPHGAPGAYRWLLERKFERSIASLPPLAGRTVVDACSGSGMDAEMLASRGAQVLAIDISHGAALRAAERARRHGLRYTVAVGDVERLPLRDRSVDIAYVHDGLHHLVDPARGVAEMARVASNAVSINEPADAFITSIAVKLGIALRREHAGNLVARLGPRAAAPLHHAGFDVLQRRYFMYYRHEPGTVLRSASRTRAAALAYRAAARATDALVGRWGNKLQLTAMRAAPPQREVDEAA